MTTVTRRQVIGAGEPSGHAGHAHAHAPAPVLDPAQICSSGPSAAIAGDAYIRYTAEMHAGMQTMMRDMHAEPPSGNPDIDFLVMMIPHHGGAVEMARLVLRDGRDPLVREIAEKILAVQLSEIQGMRGRLAGLRGGEPGFPALTGNRGP